MKLQFALPALFATAFAGWTWLAQAQQQPENEAQMQDRIAEFTAAGPNGARLTLAEITGFDWDSVRAFHGPTPREVYEAVLGDASWLTAERGRQMTDDAVRLVFLKDGTFAGQVVIAPPVWLTGTRPDPKGREAALVVASPDPGPYAHLTLE